MTYSGMNVSGANAQPIAPVQQTESKRVALQAALLKKALEAQQRETDELQRQLEGKGQILDIRV
jgi:hypothetical protein